MRSSTTVDCEVTLRPQILAERWLLIGTISSVLLAACSTSSTPSSASVNTYPSRLIGASPDGKIVGEFDPSTGRDVRTLATNANAPRVAAAARTVFFLRPSTADVCSTDIFAAPVAKGDAKHVASLNGLVSVWAISSNGDEVAYVRAACAPRSAPELSVRNLRTGTEIDIGSPYAGAVQLAWAPDDLDLAVSAPAPPNGAPQLFILHNPFENPPTAVTSVACPSGELRCEELSPAYDPKGHLTYLADVPPVGGACVATCGPVNYTVSSVNGQVSTPLVAVSGRWHSATPAVPSLSVDSLYGYFLVTVATINSLATYVCVPHGQVSRLQSGVLDAQWSR